MITKTFKLIFSAALLLYGVGLPMATLIMVQRDESLLTIEKALLGTQTACEQLEDGKTYFDIVFPVKILACLLETPIK